MMTNTVAFRRRFGARCKATSCRCGPVQRSVAAFGQRRVDRSRASNRPRPTPIRSPSLGNIAGQFTTWQQTIGNNVNTHGSDAWPPAGSAAERGRDPRERCKQHSQSRHKARCRRSRLAMSWRTRMPPARADTGDVDRDGADAGNRHGGAMPIGARRRTRRCCTSQHPSRSRLPAIRSIEVTCDADVEGERRRGNPGWHRSGHRRCDLLVTKATAGSVTVSCPTSTGRNSSAARAGPSSRLATVPNHQGQEVLMRRASPHRRRSSSPCGSARRRSGARAIGQCA